MHEPKASALSARLYSELQLNYNLEFIEFSHFDCWAFWPLSVIKIYIYIIACIIRPRPLTIWTECTKPCNALQTGI